MAFLFHGNRTDQLVSCASTLEEYNTDTISVCPGSESLCSFARRSVTVSEIVKEDRRNRTIDLHSVSLYVLGQS